MILSDEEVWALHQVQARDETRERLGFGRARALADTVLLEGYVLYPYRADAPKNQLRWSFGVVAPRAFSERGGSDPWWIETRCLVEAQGPVRLEGLLRFLRLQARRIERFDPARGTFEPVRKLEVDGALHVSWDEGVLTEIDVAEGIPLDPGTETTVGFALEGRETEALLRQADGTTAGRVRRICRPLEGQVRVRVEAAGENLLRLSIRLENRTPWDDGARDDALASAALSSHFLLGADGGAFLSLLDPPPAAAALASTCKGSGSWPVLAGPRGDRRLVLAAPIILYDHPQLAPESPGDLCDATEIDELLSLRTATLTEAEKRMARATDPRAKAIVDRVERMAPGAWERLHGARRGADPAGMQPLRNTVLGPGDRVRLRPGKRRTDAQDLLYAGMSATVHRVEADAEGATWLAVTVDDDPAAELHEWYGRFHYYLPEEVEPLEEAR